MVFSGQQEAGYEVATGDWNSEVCSSDVLGSLWFSGGDVFACVCRCVCVCVA